MNQATEIYSREFDAVFFALPPAVRDWIETKIRELGRRLENFPHHRLLRLQDRSEFCLRAGDYRIIYEFDPTLNGLFPATLGHRREVHRF